MSIRLRMLVLLSFALVSAAFAFPNPTGKIQGKVKAENGKQLAGVTIKATRAKTRALDSTDDAPAEFQAISDDKGDFTLAQLPAGSYLLSFEASGFKAAATLQRIELADGQTFKYPKPFELKPNDAPYAWIRGAVLDTSGYSLPNVELSIERVDGKKFKKIEKTSSEGGEFGFRVPGEKGTYRITAAANGYKSNTKDVSVDSDEIRQVVIQLEKKE